MQPGINNIILMKKMKRNDSIDWLSPKLNKKLLADKIKGEIGLFFTNKFKTPDSGIGYKAGVKKISGPVNKLTTLFKSSKSVIIGKTYIPIKKPKSEIPNIGKITIKISIL